MANLSTFSRPVLSSQALMLSNSRLIANIKELSSLSGEFYFYEPRKRLLNSGKGEPLSWQSVSPNEADSLSMGELGSERLQQSSREETLFRSGG